MKETWENYDAENQIKRKAEYIKQLIPKDVKNILDVGCGNGIITNELIDKWEAVGLDVSDEALKYLKCPTIKASATEIPLGDNSFDLVLCSEMLEHLTDNELNKAVKEIKRISKKYLIITVPNNEYLEASNTLCHQCNNIFHVWQHYQSFSGNRLKDLFSPEYQITLFGTFGPVEKRWLPLLVKIKHKIGQWMNPGKSSICPNCGNTVFGPFSSNLATKSVNGLNKILSGTKHYWQISLFEKKILS